MKLRTDLNGVDGGVKKSVFTMLADHDACSHSTVLANRSHLRMCCFENAVPRGCTLMGLVHSSPAEKVIRPRVGWQDCRRQLCLMGVTCDL